MSKYIVDAPELKPGQVLSSGGIREGCGKLVSQYKNPIPYNEQYAQSLTPSPSSTEPVINNQYAKNIASSLIGCAIVELTVPLISYGMNKLSEKIINKIEEKKNPKELYVPCSYSGTLDFSNDLTIL